MVQSPDCFPCKGDLWTVGVSLMAVLTALDVLVLNISSFWIRIKMVRPGWSSVSPGSWAALHSLESPLKFFTTKMGLLRCSEIFQGRLGLPRCSEALQNLWRLSRVQPGWCLLATQQAGSSNCPGMPPGSLNPPRNLQSQPEKSGQWAHGWSQAAVPTGQQQQAMDKFTYILLQTFRFHSHQLCDCSKNWILLQPQLKVVSPGGKKTSEKPLLPQISTSPTNTWEQARGGGAARSGDNSGKRKLDNLTLSRFHWKQATTC